MKYLEKDNLNTLLKIIGSNPSLQIAHFAQKYEILTDMLSEYCNTRDYLYQIYTLNLPSYEKLCEQYTNIENTDVKKFSLARKSYMSQGRQYDFIFITINIDDNFKEEFLKRVHKIIRNAGNIVIFIPKEDNTKKHKWIELLEETNYVATSYIDDLFEYYDVIISKKMHGWGNI